MYVAMRLISFKTGILDEQTGRILTARKRNDVIDPQAVAQGIAPIANAELSRHRR